MTTIICIMYISINKYYTMIYKVHLSSVDYHITSINVSTITYYTYTCTHVHIDNGIFSIYMYISYAYMYVCNACVYACMYNDVHQQVLYVHVHVST